MLVAREINTFNDLMDMAWSGAVDTLNDITRADKEIELMNLMDDCFMNEIINGETPTETEINDWLWFDRDFIYEHCGLNKNGELPADEDDMLESLENLNDAEHFDDFCDDCGKCCLDAYSVTIGDCKAMFENIKNQVVQFDDFKNKVMSEF